MPTIAHISDLHLQSGIPARQAQVEPILKKINAMKPDLVVISGDVTDDGWDSIDELKWAKAWLDERIEGEWFAVPGNHDVGNFSIQSAGHINTTRIQAWKEVFREFEAKTLWPWIILGINSMLFGSDVEEASQIESPILHLPAMDNLRVAVFIHSPLFVETICEPHKSDTNYWLGPGINRQSFWKTITEHSVDLIGSGHVHQTRLTEVDGIKIAWAPPASGTWVHAPGLPNPPMPEQTGFFMHTLHDDGRVETELIECAPMLKLYEHQTKR